MCILCIEIRKDKMTVKEIASAYMEMKIPPNHDTEIAKLLVEKQILEEVCKNIINLESKD
jgi:hypothetical protein